MTGQIPITSKGFTLFTPVKEGEPNKIRWVEGGKEKVVTYLVKSSMGLFQRFRMDEKLWVPVGTGDKTVFFKRSEWKELTSDEQAKLTNFFTTTFREAMGITKKVHVQAPELGREVSLETAKKVKKLVRDSLVELVAAARSSIKGTSKLKLSDRVGVIRCETTKAGEVKLSATKHAGKGSFLAARKMIDFGSAEKIVVGNKVYGYLKLHSLKTLSPEEAQSRIQLLREEIENMRFFSAHGVQNMAKLIQIKMETRRIGETEVEVPVGIMVEWCDLGDAEWVAKNPPQRGTTEYFDCIRAASDAAASLASLHSQDIGYVHGDVKPGNILLTSADGRLRGRLGDFGSCVPIGTQMKQLSGAYSAPELWKSNFVATPQAEAWSFGVTLLEMFHGADCNEFAKMSSHREWVGALGTIKQNLDPSDPIDALILECFKRPELRPTLQQVAERLQTLLPRETPPAKPLSSKEKERAKAKELQRLYDWKLAATTPKSPDVRT